MIHFPLWSEDQILIFVCFTPVHTVILGLHSQGRAPLTLTEEPQAGRTSRMTRSGKEGPRATSQRMRRTNVITPTKKERILMTRGRETGSQVLPGSGVEDIMQELYHEPAVCVNLDILHFVKKD